MNKDLIVGLYDLLAYLTTHYSEMPVEFRSRFSEECCGKFRQSLFNVIFNEEDHE